MKILIAPDKFKGSLSARQVAEIIAQQLLRSNPALRIDRQPVADGGEGTAELLTQASGGQLLTERVADPLFRRVEAVYGISGDGKTAFIEMAQASGLFRLTPDERDPLMTSTFGTGELIRAALRRGVQTIVLCIGGSATNDGGIGMAAALGYRLTDAAGRALIPVGQNLLYLHHVDASGIMPQLSDTNFVVACDVENPLYGPEGAAYVYGPQKGADDRAVRHLDAGLRHLADVISGMHWPNPAYEPGSGAAGGLGYGARVFLNADLQSGFSLAAAYLNLSSRIAGADLVITGEGRLDEQTLSGKVIGGIARLAGQHRVPVVAFCGRLQLSPEQIRALGLAGAIAITPEGMTFADAIRQAPELLANAVETEISRFIPG